MKNYLSLARIDSWTKNLTALVGCILASLLSEVAITISPMLLVIAGLCLASSANYTINEWIDARFDLHHPVKNRRAAVQHDLSATIIVIQYVILALLSVYLAYMVNTESAATI